MQVVICSAKKVSKCPEKGRVMEMPKVSSALPGDQENLNVHYRLPLQGLLLGGDQLAWPNYLQILGHPERQVRKRLSGTLLSAMITST
jgi:hypothetical protein